MNRFEAFKASLFRRDAAGRTVYVPSRLKGVYVVPESERDRVAQAVYQARGRAMVLALVSFGLYIVHFLWLLGALAAAWLEYGEQRKVVGTLERSSDSVADLPPIDRGARRLARAQAFGRRYFWDQIAAGTLFVALALFVLVGPPAHYVADAGKSRDFSNARTMTAILLLFGLWSIASGVYALRLIGRQPTTTAPNPVV